MHEHFNALSCIVLFKISVELRKVLAFENFHALNLLPNRLAFHLVKRVSVVDFQGDPLSRELMGRKFYYSISSRAYNSLDAEFIDRGTHVVALFVLPNCIDEELVGVDALKDRRLPTLVGLIPSTLLSINCTNNLLILRILVLAEEVMSVAAPVRMALVVLCHRSVV